MGRGKYLKDPQGRKYTLHSKDDRFLQGPYGEKYQLSPDGTLYKVSSEDGRFLVDDKDKKFVLAPSGEKYYHHPQESSHRSARTTVGYTERSICHWSKRRTLSTRSERCKIRERFLPGPNGAKFYPDPVDENYATGPTGEKYMVDCQEILYPVDSEVGRYEFYIQ
ncbi:hypothetical protein QE152_g3610 [Popillia japonica]|uniref:Uncharacterized protein n=1 Tax=Popillia japonica TaxID=7064 RepID=A0AAW1N1K1_POPJA